MDAAVDIQWEISTEPGKPDSAGLPAPGDLAGETAADRGAEGLSDHHTASTTIPTSVVVSEAMYDVYGKFLQACRWFEVNEEKFLHPDHLRLILQSSSKYVSL